MWVRTAIRLGRSSLSERSTAASIAAVSLPSVDALRVPAVGVEALEHVLAPGHGRRAVELDVVVVPEVVILPEAQVAGEGRGLGGDALLEVAVRDDAVDPVVDDLRGPAG